MTKLIKATFKSFRVHIKHILHVKINGNKVYSLLLELFFFPFSPTYILINLYMFAYFSTKFT